MIELREAIRTMTPRQQLYRVLKEELSIKGHWRNLPRGNPKEGYRKSRVVLAEVNRRW